MNTAKKIMILDQGWRVKRLEHGKYSNYPALLKAFSEEGAEREDAIFPVSRMPAQIHEILMEHNMIENPNIRGNGEPCLWVGEYDWLYVKDFDASNDEGIQIISFDGLDTYVDIYLNSELLARHDDAYLPLSIDITGKLQGQNQLMLHFKSPRKMLDAIPLSEYERARIAVGARSRAFGSTYGDYLGPKPYLMRVGVYGDITVAVIKNAAIGSLHAGYTLSEDMDKAVLTAEVTCSGNTERCCLRFELLDPYSRQISVANIPAMQNEDGQVIFAFTVDTPELWFPRSHGKQPLYTLNATLLTEDERALDAVSKRVGFRKIKKVGDFEFLINGLPLKLWGSNLAPLDTLTNVYNKEKMVRLLDLVEMSHQNCLRVWGENERLNDDFYDQCDQRGILIWQDFFATYSMYPVRERMYRLMAAEAKYQVTRLRDHPCILLWCGGNESLMMRDYDFPGEEFMGLEIFNEIFPSICAQLDPQRYYHRSSPDMGRFANDPMEGDTHGYTHIWYVPGHYYPVFLSENCRVSTPALRSIKRMMLPEDLWPAGYDGHQHKNSEMTWPESWNKYNSNFGYHKLGPVENYYDATDLESMLYRIGWGHGEYIRSRVERYRRGRPCYSHDTDVRITKGHLLWKLNNSSNHIFFGVLDYFLEPYIPFYALKRAYAPVLLSFEVGDFIHLWLVNDTTETILGNIHVRLWDPFKNSEENHFELKFSIAPDQSSLLCDLNAFGQFKHNRILHAYAVAADGRRLAESFGYTDIERHLRFPDDGTITMALEKDILTLTCDRYMRSVELLGKDGGEEFGWIFEDNYFDMIPGQIKRVKVFTKHRQGVISAKGYYSREGAELSYSNFPCI